MNENFYSFEPNLSPSFVFQTTLIRGFLGRKRLPSRGYKTLFFTQIKQERNQVCDAMRINTMLLHSKHNVIVVQSQWYSILKALNLKWKYYKRYNTLNINEFCEEWSKSFILPDIIWENRLRAWIRIEKYANKMKIIWRVLCIN